MQQPPPQNHPLNVLIANLSSSTPDPYLLQLYERIKQYLKENGTKLFLTEYVPLLLQHPFCNVNTYGIHAVNELFKILQYLTPQHTDIETLNLLRWTNHYTPLNKYIINTSNKDILKGVNYKERETNMKECINKEIIEHKPVPNPTPTLNNCINKEILDNNYEGVNNLDNTNPTLTPNDCINKEILDNNYEGVNNLDNPIADECINKEVLDNNYKGVNNLDNTNPTLTPNDCINNSNSQNEVITGILLLLQQFIPFNIKQALDLYMYICEHYNINYTSYLTNYPSLYIDTLLHRINCILNKSPGINTLYLQSLSINTLIDKEVETNVKELLSNTPLTNSTSNNTPLITSTSNTTSNSTSLTISTDTKTPLNNSTVNNTPLNNSTLINTLLISDLSTVKHFIIKQHLYFQTLENKSNFSIPPVNNTYSNIFISSNDNKGVIDTPSNSNHIYINTCYSQVNNYFEFSNNYKGFNYNTDINNYNFITETVDLEYNTVDIDSNGNPRDNNNKGVDNSKDNGYNNDNDSGYNNNNHTNPINTHNNNNTNIANNLTCVRQLLDKITTYLSMFKDNTLYNIYNNYCNTNTSNKIICAKYLDRIYCKEVLKGVNSLIESDIEICLYVYKSIWNRCINNKGILGGDNDSSRLEGVSNSSSVLEGVNDKDSVLEGVNNSSSVLEGVSDKDTVLEGVSHSTTKQQGDNNSTNNYHPLINTPSNQHPLTNTPNNYHPLTTYHPVTSYISKEYLKSIYSIITPSIDIPVNLLINYVKTTVNLLNSPSSSVNECISLAGCYGYFIKYYNIKEMVMLYVCMYWMWGDKIRSVLCKWLVNVVRVIKESETNSKFKGKESKYSDIGEGRVNKALEGIKGLEGVNKDDEGIKGLEGVNKEEEVIKEIEGVNKDEEVIKEIEGIKGLEGVNKDEEVIKEEEGVNKEVPFRDKEIPFNNNTTEEIPFNNTTEELPSGNNTFNNTSTVPIINTLCSSPSIKEALGNKSKDKGLNELKVDDITVIEGEDNKGCYNSNDILGNITPFNDETYNTGTSSNDNRLLDNSSNNTLLDSSSNNLLDNSSNTLLNNSSSNNTLLDSSSNNLLDNSSNTLLNNSSSNNTPSIDINTPLNNSTNYPYLISELLSGLSVFECTSLSLKRIITDVSVSNDNIRKNFIGCMMEVLNYYEEEFKVIIIENMLNNSNDWRYRVILMLKVIETMGVKGLSLVSKLEKDKVFYVRKVYEEIKEKYNR
ncbi:hypothetical protein CWI39_1321p0010 [Hamiltosporidium magnivora]|uniref:Uncharacterized protein n=1 Tax=Hamiltosporidium magnivora TaxID=148818 RepID=A0A4Q9L3S3_9MICR|nr:hypothetical protein CWI39_1321p0010 [Hamiltosporidium magnivora]